MNIEVLLVAAPFLANVMLGVLVIAQRPRTLENKFFFVAALSITLWSTASYLTDNAWSYSAKEVCAYITYGGAMLSIGALHWFSIAFRGRSKDLKSIKLDVVLTVVLAIASATPLVVAGINPTDDYTEVLPGPMAIPYYIILAVLFIMTARNMIISSRSTKKDLHKKQAQIIVWGTGLSFALILLTNAVLPVITGNWSTAALGPSLTVFIVGSITYSIVKHGLFDIRLAVARALGYIGATVSLLLVYIALVYLFSGNKAIGAELSVLQRVVFALIAVLSGLLFQPFKSFFDKITNSFFYRDSYDTQALLDELNKTLVSSTELEELLTKCSLILQENLKSSYCTFYIRETSYLPSRIIGAHRREPEIKGIDDLEVLTPKIRKKIFSVDSRQSSDEEKKLAKVLRDNDFSVIARLVSTLEYEVKGMGYFFLGPKKSGSPFTKQDIKTLEIIANELVIGIENVLRFEEIQEFNVTLQKKIDDATKELKSNNQKLLALDEAKDEFVSMASHQLRTPLTSIKGYLSMVLEEDAGKVTDTQREMLGQAFFSSQRMVYLISDLLNVSRLKTGKFTIESKPVKLPEVVESEISQLQEGAKAKNLTLSFTKPDKFSTLNLDEMKIRQVVMNFTDNAIYYTPSGGKISVELKETPKAVEFRVKDSGIGVPKDEKHKLFTKFYRADNARKTRPDGTGLGLFMAKKVIVAQGGSIIFDSKEGKGSTFGFSFPKEKLLVTDKNTEEPPNTK